MRREALIRQLATYLNSIGVPAYVLPEHQHERCSFVPYIFTREQICSLLKAADSLPYAYRSPNMYNVYPFLIRLLYCCGLRISEALHRSLLLRGGISLCSWYFYAPCIPQDMVWKHTYQFLGQPFPQVHELQMCALSKYNNTRLVPMSESLFACLRNYMNAVRYSENDTGLLFRNRWGKAYRPNSILQKYKKLLEEAGIPCTASDRVHIVP